ncbi:translation initiation factor IF-3 [Arcobacter sp. F2176]|jgi:translation initiation factor IF-3|uniref:translation initiation factor IF-3 n=1 Tax=Arcobacter TaxID=28196 RepID=UPI0013E99551|nr:translation initiation factor IF-3 [Arcobacter sp. F2176]|eukprot:TRINITY_DN1263_c0_g1_i1.p2 TRINITY_DN1263_c0_g1~~TRINITY_DN1263_c0_g1_i1.p2  ORF type:complete len:165 (+),score=8.74 TRINITY_DN1263_c0_g1_i1:2184-2678(+)
MNDDITAKEVRCMGDDGTNYGIISTADALKTADEQGLDLVLIAPEGKPPVAKIMDYSKFKYQQEKKKKEARKNQKVIVLKEVKFSVKIAENDINYKVKHAIEFLEKGFHVKCRVFLKGREMAHPEAGAEVLEKVWPMLEDYGDRDSEPKLEGRFVNMMVLPKKD